MRTTALVIALFASLLAGCAGSARPETCSLKPESGKCRASISRYWFDERAGTCKAFIWGGCGGVAPFETMEDCRTQCMAGQTPAVDARPAAPAAPEQGMAP